MFLSRLHPVWHVLMLFLWSLLFLAITGCENTPEFKDGYPFGDVTRLTARNINELDNARNAYCAKTSHSLIRQAALTVIRQQLPDIPEYGLCTTLDKLISSQPGNDGNNKTVDEHSKNFIRDGPVTR